MTGAMISIHSDVTFGCSNSCSNEDRSCDEHACGQRCAYWKKPIAAFAEVVERAEKTTKKQDEKVDAKKKNVKRDEKERDNEAVRPLGPLNIIAAAISVDPLIRRTTISSGGSDRSAAIITSHVLKKSGEDVTKP